jgi:uncharacterized protein
VLLRYLDRLSGLVDAAQAQVGDSLSATDELLAARLAPDMAPFALQVLITANFSLRASFPLAGEPVPPFGHFDTSFDGLRQHIAHAAGLLRTLQPAQFALAEQRVLQDRAGDAMVSLPAARFLFEYAMPNFFFHLGMAYAILRSHGVVIGKADFDGWHRYPPAG